MFTWHGFIGFLMLVLTVAVVFVVVIILCYVRDFLLNDFPKWNKRRLLRKNAESVIILAVYDYTNRNGYQNLVAERFWKNGKTVCDKSLKKYQKFLDQVLKMCAGDMQFFYDQEDGLRRRYKSKDKPDSLSGDEIMQILREENNLIISKEKAEKKFWELHATLEALGLETWGHKSYKVYLCLKPFPPTETLCH